MAAEATRKASSPLMDAVRMFTRNVPAVIALVMILLLAAAAVTGALYAGRKADAGELVRMEEASLLGDRYKTEAVSGAVLDPTKTELKDTFLPPGSVSNADPEVRYWLGTDHLGRDVFARLWAGSSISLTIGFLSVGIMVLLGIAMGGIAGYFGRSRVALPAFATLLCTVAWGILLAADLPVAAWSCFAAGAALLLLQLAVAVSGGRWRAVALFIVVCAAVAGVSLFNWRTETATPEGALLQEAARTHQQSRSLLLRVRDIGREVKAWEEAGADHLERLTAQRDVPVALYGTQLEVEIRTRQLAMQVARLDVAKSSSALREAERLHTEQQERAAFLEQFLDAYAARNKEALDAKTAAEQEADAHFKAGRTAEGRKALEAVAAHNGRATTFDPAELRKRIARLQAIGTARLSYVNAIEEKLGTLATSRLEAAEKAHGALEEALAAGAGNGDELRQRQLAVEAAMRDYAVADADLKLQEAQLRVATIEPLLAEAKDAAKTDLEGELKKWQGQAAAAKTAIETVQKSVDDLKSIIVEKDAASAAKRLAPWVVQGSNELIDRRGKLRNAYVIRYDTETKNARTALHVAETLDGKLRYGAYRITSHFLAATVLYLLLAVAALGLMASAQGAVADTRLPVRFLFMPTISVDDLVMRFTEIMMTIPVIFLILAILAVFEKDVYITMGVIGLTGWMGTTRFVRAEILSLREQDFVQAARALGLSDFRIIWRHLVPNAISPVLVSASIGVAGAVLSESTLSFLGIGAKPEQTTWGLILSEGREFIFDAPWLTWIPGIAILITVLAFNLLGEGLREAFNPKLRGR